MKLNRRRFMIAASSLAVLAAVPAEAWVRGRAGATGKTVLNGFDRYTSFAFCNMLKSAVSLQFGASATPADFNDNGFPAATPPNLIGLVAFLPNDGSTWVLKAPSTGGTGGFFLSHNIQVTAVGGTVNGVTYGAGGQTTGAKPSGVTITGQSQWRVVFTLNAPVGAGGMTIGFPNSGTYTNMSALVLCRLQDEDAVDADPNAFTPEFKASVVATGSNYLRVMNWSLLGSDAFGQAHYSLRVPPTAFSFMTSRYPASKYAGTTGGTSTAYTCGDTAVPSLSAWTDGLTWQCKFNATNTSTTPTIAPNGLTPKTMVRMRTGGPLNTSGSEYVPINTIGTCIYDALLDKVLFIADGIFYGPPIEVKIALCNQLNKNYWHNVPMNYTLESATTEAGYIASNLAPLLHCAVESSNETWNFTVALAGLRGQALGFTATNARDYLGYYGMRSRQILGLFTTAFAGRASTLKRVLAFQAAQGSASTTSTYMWKGSDLASVANGGAGNATWVSFTGDANYRTGGARPIDYCEWVSYAPYYAGAQCAGFDANYIARGTANLTGVKGAADDYASGVPAQMASALAWLDNDIRQGTYASSGADGYETLKSIDRLHAGVGYYPLWQAQLTADSFSQKVVCYEAACQSWYPTTTTANTLWGDTSYGGSTGKIAVLLAAYKNTQAFSDLTRDACKQFMGLDPSSPNFGLLPNSLYPSWFTFDGADNQWSMFPENVIVGSPYKSLNGVAAWNAS
jgi:hypothetical protein